mmetsp:Transcript_62162/g.158055  ORF Transcript_62162/g.158055 Transcript_62162/m.158055 type:complete len:205 (-) Transcript_62162:1270-1884(-)
MCACGNSWPSKTSFKATDFAKAVYYTQSYGLHELQPRESKRADAQSRRQAERCSAKLAENNACSAHQHTSCPRHCRDRPAQRRVTLTPKTIKRPPSRIPRPRPSPANSGPAPPALLDGPPTAPGPQPPTRPNRTCSKRRPAARRASRSPPRSRGRGRPSPPSNTSRSTRHREPARTKSPRRPSRKSSSGARPPRGSSRAPPPSS